MGTWGAGVFESDDALEFRDKMINELVHQIVYHLADEALTGWPPGNGNGGVVAAADILALWGEHDGKIVQITTGVVQHWHTLSLQHFDADAAKSEDQSPEHGQFCAERRKVIEATFDRLEKVVYATH